METSKKNGFWMAGPLGRVRFRERLGNEGSCQVSGAGAPCSCHRLWALLHSCSSRGPGPRLIAPFTPAADSHDGAHNFWFVDLGPLFDGSLTRHCAWSSWTGA